jgi:hypothetical protein
LRIASCLARRLHGRQQQRYEHPDNRDHHQQLDEGKTPPTSQASTRDAQCCSHRSNPWFERHGDKPLGVRKFCRAHGVAQIAPHYQLEPPQLLFLAPRAASPGAVSR